jgi:hypothetical protein
MPCEWCDEEVEHDKSCPVAVLDRAGVRAAVESVHRMGWEPFVLIADPPYIEKPAYAGVTACDMCRNEGDKSRMDTWTVALRDGGELWMCRQHIMHQACLEDGDMELVV